MNKDNFIKEKYENVASMLESSLEKAHSVRLSGEEENAELELIMAQLEEINSEFKQEIEKLEKSSEWEKYCVAFFGETNAGKSTIIESLRIIFDEDQRRAELDRQDKEYASELSEHCDERRELLEKLKEINNSLTSETESKHEDNLKLKIKIFSSVGLVFIGIIIGFVISSFLI